MNEERWSVSLGDGVVSVVEPDGTRVDADVEELALIHITTNDQGPAGSDVWWVMENAGDIILGAFPMGAAGEQR
jgi:hypothetical protein